MANDQFSRQSRRPFPGIMADATTPKGKEKYLIIQAPIAVVNLHYYKPT